MNPADRVRKLADVIDHQALLLAEAAGDLDGQVDAMLGRAGVLRQEAIELRKIAEAAGRSAATRVRGLACS